MTSQRKLSTDSRLPSTTAGARKNEQKVTRTKSSLAFVGVRMIGRGKNQLEKFCLQLHVNVCFSCSILFHRQRARSHTHNNCNNNKWCLTIELFNSSHSYTHSTSTYENFLLVVRHFFCPAPARCGGCCRCSSWPALARQSNFTIRFFTFFYIVRHAHPHKWRSHKTAVAQRNGRCSTRKSPAQHARAHKKAGFWINLYLQHLDLLNLLHSVRRVFTISVCTPLSHTISFVLAAVFAFFNPNCATIKSTFVGKLHGTHDWMRSMFFFLGLFRFRDARVFSSLEKRVLWHGCLQCRSVLRGAFSFGNRQQLYYMVISVMLLHRIRSLLSKHYIHTINWRPGFL